MHLPHQRPACKAGPARPPAPRLPALGTTTTTKAFEDSRRSACEATFTGLLQACGDASELWLGIRDSPAQTSHTHQILLALAHTTLSKYLRCVAAFLDWLQSFACSLLDIAWPCLADYLYAARRSASEDRASNRLPPTTAIKALRWFARVAQISSLQAAMHAPLVGSYALPGAARDRREAYPLPMSLVCEWERKICRPACPLPLLLWLGAALLCVHASLRWSDAMRVEWSSLSLTSTHLHGTCYKTKTSSHGQPFAVHICGFTGHLPSTCWVLAWLAGLTQALQLHPQAQPDFLFPLADISKPALPCLMPSSYHHSLQTLRWAACLPWHEWWDPNDKQALLPEESRQLALHCLKSCLLAAAAQLRLPREDRMQQGKHRDSAGLYSRDDTIASLHVQEKVRQALHSGWRPARSMARGGQAPLPEPPLKPFFKPAWTVLSPTVLSQPALARWTTRQERDTDTSSASIPISMPPSPAPPVKPAAPSPTASLDSEAALVRNWALEHPCSSSDEDASPVASNASGASDVEPAPSPAQTPGPPCLTTGPWAALHCLDAESHALFLRSGDRSDLRPACGAPCQHPVPRASTPPQTSAAALLAACSASRSKPAPQRNCSCLPACSPATLAPARSRFLA